MTRKEIAREMFCEFGMSDKDIAKGEEIMAQLVPGFLDKEIPDEDIQKEKSICRNTVMLRLLDPETFETMSAEALTKIRRRN